MTQTQRRLCLLHLKSRVLILLRHCYQDELKVKGKKIHVQSLHILLLGQPPPPPSAGKKGLEPPRAEETETKASAGAEGDSKQSGGATTEVQAAQEGPQKPPQFTDALKEAEEGIASGEIEVNGTHVEVGQENSPAVEVVVKLMDYVSDLTQGSENPLSRDNSNFGARSRSLQDYVYVEFERMVNAGEFELPDGVTLDDFKDNLDDGIIGIVTLGVYDIVAGRDSLVSLDFLKETIISRRNRRTEAGVRPYSAAHRASSEDVQALRALPGTGINIPDDMTQAEMYNYFLSFLEKRFPKGYEKLSSLSKKEKKRITRIIAVWNNLDSGHKFKETDWKEGLARYLARSCIKGNLNPFIIMNQILFESHVNPKALSSAGAGGLLQFMKPTFDPYKAAIIKEGEDPKRVNPKASIIANREHIKDLAANHGKDTALVLAAYNAGGPAVRKHGGVPPYPETENYVHGIMSAAHSDYKEWKKTHRPST